MTYACRLYRVLQRDCGWSAVEAMAGVRRWYYSEARQLAEAEGDDRKRVLRGLRQGKGKRAAPVGVTRGREGSFVHAIR